MEVSAITTLFPFSFEYIQSTEAITGSLALIAVLVLLVLLIQKDMIMADQSGRLQRLRQILNVAIAPLMIAFIVIAIFRVIEYLK